MVYRKRTYGRRRKFTYRRKTRYRPKSYRKFKKSRSTTRAFISKRFVKGSFNLQTATSTGTFAFTLNAVPNYTEFTNLFDKYRIVKATINFRSNSQPQACGLTAAGTTTGYGGGTFYYVTDYDDADAITLNDIEQYPGRRSFLIGDQKAHTITCYPAFAKQIYQSAIATGYGPGRGYVDCTYPNIPHFGVKWFWQPYAIDPVTPQPVAVLNWDITYVLAFKDQR